jgi:hypothetical protein
MISKGSYLRQLISPIQSRYVTPAGKEITGSSPPSLFIGSQGYPHVYAGPLITCQHGDTAVMDTPESWIPQQKTQEEIIGFRLNLVRGKTRVSALDLNSRFIEKLQDIALSATSIESKAVFLSPLAGNSFSEDHTLFGPSGILERFETETTRWDRNLEKVYYDTDMNATEALVHLHENGVLFSTLQKAFSVGTMGSRKKRHLVPTRWAITACDSVIGDHLLSIVRNCPVIDTVRVHEFSSLHNHYAVILLPTAWEYEWSEAFFHVRGNEELVFSDYEGRKKKNGYSFLGGCYYTCRMAVLEALMKEKIQAGAIVLREATHGYVPMGVFNVRENIRNAMDLPPMEFDNIASALAHIAGGFSLPVYRFVEESVLLPAALQERQCTLHDFS